MRNELKHIEEIENYLSGKLSKKERVIFESRLQSDSELSNEVELQKNLTERIAVIGFAHDIKSYHQEWISIEAKNLQSGFKAKWFLNTFLAIFVTSLTAFSIYYFSKSAEPKLVKEDQKINSDSTLVKKKRNIHSNGSVSFIPNGPTYSSSTPTTYSFTSPGRPKTMGQILNADSIIPAGKTEDVLKRLQVPFEEITMDAQEGKEFTTKVSGSRVVMPAGILQYQNGMKVIGEVTIRYREFRNAAEMAFSGIPMEHEQNGEQFQMNSTGMIEIRAVQNGEELKIGKNNYFMLDYNVTESLDDTYFWSMNDQTKKWTCQDTLKYGNPNPEISEAEEEKFGMLTGKFFNALTKDTLYYAKIKLTPVGDLGQTVSSTYYNDTGFVMPKVKPGKYHATISKDGFDSYTFENIDLAAGQYRQLVIELKPAKMRPHIFSKKIFSSLSKDSYNRKLKNIQPSGKLTGFNDIPQELKGEFAMTENTSEMIYENNLSIRKKRKKSSEINEVKPNKPKFMVITAEKESAAKDNFSKTVYGLNCAGFGVYNCDQIKRMQEPVKVRPMFGNVSNSPDASLYKEMVVIDKNMNSVFRFFDQEFSCSKDGKNVLLVYFQGKIYGVSEQEFSSLQIKNNGTYTFPLNDITDQLQSTEDLKKYLGL